MMTFLQTPVLLYSSLPRHKYKEKKANLNLLYTDKGRGFWYLEGHSDFPYVFLYLFVDGAIKCKRAQSDFFGLP